MLRILCLVTGFGMLVISVWANPGTPPGFQLTVFVTDSITAQPLEAATVVLAERYQTKITGPGGKTTWDSLPAGTYTVNVSLPGYHNSSQRLWLNRNTVLTVQLCPMHLHVHEIAVTGHSDDMQHTTANSRNRLNSQMLERSASVTLSGMLAQLPGVSVLSTGPIISKPVIRGLHSNRIVTVQNGIRQEGQQWGADHGLETDPFSVHHAEIIKGAASVEYGPEALGGVIQLSPRNLRDTRGLDGAFISQWASNNHMGASSLWLEGNHFNSHNLSWRVQGSLRKAGDSQTPDYNLSNTGFEEQSGQFVLHYRFRNFHVEWSQQVFRSGLGILRAAHAGNRTDLLRAVALGTPAFTAPFTYTIDLPRQQVMHTVSALRVYTEFKNGFTFQTQISRQYNQREEFDRPPRSSQRELYETTPAYRLLVITDQAELKFEHPRIRHFKGLVGGSFMNQGNVSEGLQPIIPNFRAYTFGAFAIEKWQHGRWSAEAGIRLDQREQIRFINENGTTVSNRQVYRNTSFSTGMSYRYNEFVKHVVAFTSAWRPPAINELYSYGLHGGTAVFEIGNPLLQPERSLQVETGLQVQHTRWDMEFTVFRHQVDGFIYAQPDPNPTITIRGAFPVYRFVQEAVHMTGAELQLRYHWNGNLESGVKGAVLESRVRSDNRPVPLMPANRFMVFATYTHEQTGRFKNLFLTPEVLWVDRQHLYTPGSDLIPPPDSYLLVSIQSGFEFRIGKQPLRLNLSVNNLFNARYRDYLSRFRYYTHEPGTNLNVRLLIPINFKNKTS